jgi:hypothetical protein
MPDTRRPNDSLFCSARHSERGIATKRTVYSSIDHGGAKRRVFSLRDTRNASNTLHNEDAHARIDRVHNRNSRATTGPRPGPRSRKTSTHGYEHRVNSRNNEARAWISRSDLGSGGGPRAFLRRMPAGESEQSGRARPHSQACLGLWARLIGNSVEAPLCWKGTD